MALVASSCVRGPVDLSVLVLWISTKSHFTSHGDAEESLGGKIEEASRMSNRDDMTTCISVSVVVLSRMYSELAG
jgi:hypothetical protein